MAQPAIAPVTPEAFGVLFEAHAQAIYTYCFRRTADWAVAEDLVSATFMEAWRRRAEIDFVGQPPLPWLYGVATNLLRNHRRSLRRYAAALARVPEARHTPDFAEDAAARLDDVRVMRDLLHQIRSLNRGEQEVLALCGWCELSYEEAAIALGIPVGTVRSRLSRARARLSEGVPS